MLCIYIMGTMVGKGQHGLYCYIMGLYIYIYIAYMCLGCELGTSMMLENIS